MIRELPPQAIRVACKKTYDKLYELDDLIRFYAEAKLKQNSDFDLVYVEDALQGISVASGRIVTFAGGWVEHD